MSTIFLNYKSMKNVKSFLVLLAFAGLSISVAQAQNVCEIGSTGYATIDAAITAVPNGGATPTVIKLLENITYEATSNMFITNKKITFYLNGFDLIFTGNSLYVENGSVIDYTGTGELKKIRSVTGTANYVGNYAMYVEDGSSCTLTGVEITDNGTGTTRTVHAVHCLHSTVVVNGDVKAINNGETNSSSTGIYADNSTVTVKGNVISSNIGVLAFSGSTVTVDGTITAEPSKYLNVGGTGSDNRTFSDFDLPTTKQGYLTYAKGTNTVWVKFPKVTNIVGVPETALVGTPLHLTGTIVPNNAYAQNIVWTVASQGTTGAVIIGNSLFATTQGTAVIMATIENGNFIGEDYTQGFYIRVENETGIPDIEAEKISVYPNPTSGELRIKSNELRIEKVEILDVTGKIVLTSGKTTIDISHLLSGIYFIKMQIASGVLVKKVIKE